MRLTDSLDIATDVYPGRKTTKLAESALLLTCTLAHLYKSIETAVLDISQLLVSASKSHSYHQCQLISQLLVTANSEQ